MLKGTMAAIAIAATCAACSSVDIKPLSESDSKSAYGARFYRPAFYLVIGGDENGKCQASILELPDMTQPYVADPRAWLFTSSSFQITLTDGWNLTGVNGSSDSTALLGAITGTGGKGSNAKNNMSTMSAFGEPDATGSKKRLGPGIYRINFKVEKGAENKSIQRLSLDSEPSIKFSGDCKDVSYNPPSSGGSQNSGGTSHRNQGG